MEPIVKNIKVTRTARYFTLGDSSLTIHTVVFALHGYGMDAKSFIRHFEPVIKPGVLIIAPEGLSRFYKKGFAGEVVSSWMTREDRMNEIEDYISYLDHLRNSLIEDKKIRTIVFGFSQGASTASRWWCMGKGTVDEIVIWCGEFAPEITDCAKELLPVVHITALKDEFITPERFREQIARLKHSGFEVKEYTSPGGHELNGELLIQVFKDLGI